MEKQILVEIDFYWNTLQWWIQDFPKEGAPTPRGRQHTILPKFPKNCMKLKEFGPRGTWGTRTPLGSKLDPPLLSDNEVMPKTSCKPKTSCYEK